MKRLVFVIVFAVIFAAMAACASQSSDRVAARAEPAGSIAPAWYEQEIRAYEAADEAAMPEPGGVLFIGSSSIRMWKSLEADMDPLPVINRGFGGSKTHEVLAVFDRIVLPYEPRVIVYYCGDNDLGTDNTDSEAAAEGFIAFDRRARAEWPGVQVINIPIKPSLARWGNWEAMRRANEMVRAYCERTPGAVYVDTATPTLDASGEPDPAMFLEDGLHLSERGYEVWTSVVRPAVMDAWARATE
jgi:lysophospholipase L1-like esterase